MFSGKGWRNLPLRVLFALTTVLMLMAALVSSPVGATAVAGPDAGVADSGGGATVIQVYDAWSGAPIAGAAVAIYNSAGVGLVKGQTSVTGQFQANLLPGFYMVNVAAANHMTVSVLAEVQIVARPTITIKLLPAPQP